MIEDANENVTPADKSKERHKKRKDKSVNLSEYIKKSDGTLVPKPKVIAKLRGVQPRQGGFMAKKPTTVQRECSTPKCRDLSELKSLADKNRNLQKPPSAQSKPLSVSSYCNLADLDMNPVDEDNIVDHFERLLLFMQQLAENPRNIKKKQAHGVIEFLESIKTPNCQLAPNAQALVDYIEHLPMEKRNEERNASNSHEEEDSDSDSDTDDDTTRKPKRTIPICPPKKDKSCPKNDKESCPKDDKESCPKDKQVDEIEKKTDEKQSKESDEKKPEHQDKNKTDSPKKGDNQPVVGFVDINRTECQPKTVFGVTLKAHDENKKCLEPAPKQFQVTAKDLVIMQKDKVQTVEMFSDDSANLNGIGDNLLCGEEIVQRCYEPASRSRSRSDNSTTSSTYEYQKIPY